MKVRTSSSPSPNRIGDVAGWNKDSHPETRIGPEWADCPGCPKCSPNDGLVLRKGAWRPTISHEYLFLLTKNGNYFGDAEAVNEEVSGNAHARGDGLNLKCVEPGDGIRQNRSFCAAVAGLVASRNLRSVWEIPTQPFPDAHFATFPEEIPLRCIKAGTSEKGCCARCGAPWSRILERGERGKKPVGWQEGAGSHAGIPQGNYGGKWIGNGDEQAASYRLNQNERYFREQGVGHDNPFALAKTLGWKPSCNCIQKAYPGKSLTGADWLALIEKTAQEFKPKSCLVLDPFSGAGTTPLVADKLGRIGIGLDLKWDYCQMAKQRCFQDAPLLIFRALDRRANV